MLSCSSNNVPVVILVAPSQDGNIGATARAMANFGLSELRLVNPTADYASLFCRQMASGANHVIDGLQVFSSTKEALADIETVYATSARRRGMIKPVLNAQHTGQEAAQLWHNGCKIGFLFGTEKWGLTNDDIALCDAIVQINLSPDHGSLNLAQAVLLVAYEWYNARQTYPAQGKFLHKGGTTFATKTEIGHLFDHLEHELDQANFWRTAKKKPIMAQTVRNIFLRCTLTHQEVKTLRGVIQALVYYRWKKPLPYGNLSPHKETSV